MGAEVVHIPTCMGGVVLSYTLSGVDSLRLTGELIADIFMGKITRWNDPRVAAENRIFVFRFGNNARISFGR